MPKCLVSNLTQSFTFPAQELRIGLARYNMAAAKKLFNFQFYCCDCRTTARDYTETDNVTTENYNCCNNISLQRKLKTLRCLYSCRKSLNTTEQITTLSRSITLSASNPAVLSLINYRTRVPTHMRPNLRLGHKDVSILERTIMFLRKTVEIVNGNSSIICI